MQLGLMLTFSATTISSFPFPFTRPFHILLSFPSWSENLFSFPQNIPSHSRPVGKKWNRGVFCKKKVDNVGCFCKNVDLASTQGALCTVLVFSILHFSYLGGAYGLRACRSRNYSLPSQFEVESTNDWWSCTPNRNDEHGADTVPTVEWRWMHEVVPWGH